MPRSTSTFIKSKMNKDTDSRILPSGEYRDAQNVSISKSEGADVGALENIRGNRALVDIHSLVGATIKNLEIIGHYMDIENDRIYMMLTNYNDTSSDRLSNFAPSNSSHYIYRYDLLTGASTQLVAGNFLNFSKTHNIYGINLIEELLFWTDDRNQPRKINVVSAAAAPADSALPYYTTEDQISVAKYYPYNSIRLYKSMGPFTNGGSGTVNNAVAVTLPTFGAIEIGDIVTTSNVTLTQQHCVTEASGSMSQGIKIDPPITYNASTTFTFYRTGMRDVTSEKLPWNIGVAAETDNPFYDANWPGDKDFLTDKFVRFSYRYRFDDGEYSLIAPFTQSAFIPKQDGYFMANHNAQLEDDDQTETYVSTIVDFMENKVDDIQFQIDTPTVVGDLYRDYKIKEIQILYKESSESNIRVLETIPYTDPSIADYQGNQQIILTSAGTGSYASTGAVVSTTTTGSGTGMTLEITTDGSAGGGSGVLLSAIIVDPGTGYVTGDLIYPGGGNGSAYFTLSVTDASTYTFNYQSTKPINSLPADQITRVYDKVPIRALAQEVSGNRVIYGNYLNKHTSPSGLDYEVKASDRLQAFETSTNYSTVQYPTHTLKQNRNYQVGIVLADRYGRQSDVVLSTNKTATSSGFGASTVFNDYRTSAENTSKDVLNWFGDSLKIVFNTPIPETIAIPGYPGLYSSTNPTGWYSYKVVVKQQQQEYYNVYLPGILNGYPYKVDERNYTAFSTLYSDNINKIPKDLLDVGPEQNQFRGGENLWGRVENFMFTGDLGGTNFAQTQSRQYYPNVISDESIQVGTITDLQLGVTKILRAQNIAAATNDFTLGSYDNDIQIGMSINSTRITTDLVATGKVINIVYPGTGYTAGTNLATTVIPSGGTSLTLDITVDDEGSITSVSTNTAGTGYSLGDIVELTGGGGSGAKFVVSAPTVTNYTEFGDASASDVKAKMTISHATTVNVPADEIFKINERGEELFYSSSTNPYLTKFKTFKPIGVNNSIMSPRLAVYETKPTFSNLDIYWETSTSGLISELNTAINDGDTTSPFALKAATGVGDPIVFDFNENDAINTFITSEFKAIKDPTAPAFITSNVEFKLASVFSGNTNVTSQFALVPQGSGGYKIQMKSLFVVGKVVSDRSFLFNIDVDLTSGSNKSTFPFALNATLANTGPTITPVAPASCGGTLAGSISEAQDNKIATFNAVNGSASSVFNTQDLTFSIRNNDNTAFTETWLELRDPTTPVEGQKELWVIAQPKTSNAGTYTKKVRVMDGGGAISSCALTFTIS